MSNELGIVVKATVKTFSPVDAVEVASDVVAPEDGASAAAEVPVVAGDVVHAAKRRTISNKAIRTVFRLRITR
jgi:hypothetical protein